MFDIYADYDVKKINFDGDRILFLDSYNSKISYMNTDGTAKVIATSTNLSDKRLKTDLGILKQNEATSFIKSLVPHKYEMFGDKGLGFFAQDVEKNSAYGNILVQKYEDHGYKDCRSLDYQSLIAPTIAALQGALEKIEKLEAKIEALENK